MDLSAAKTSATHQPSSKGQDFRSIYSQQSTRDTPSTFNFKTSDRNAFFHDRRDFQTCQKRNAPNFNIMMQRQYRSKKHFQYSSIRKAAHVRISVWTVLLRGRDMATEIPLRLCDFRALVASKVPTRSTHHYAQYSHAMYSQAMNHAAVKSCVQR